MTVVRGITSRLDFRWVRMDDDKDNNDDDDDDDDDSENSEIVVQTVVGASSTSDPQVYIDSYTTPFLNESDTGTMYFCMISLNDGRLVILMDSTNFTLDTLFSEDTYIMEIYACTCKCMYVCFSTN